MNNDRMPESGEVWQFVLMRSRWTVSGLARLEPDGEPIVILTRGMNPEAAAWRLTEFLRKFQPYEVQS